MSRERVEKSNLISDAIRARQSLRGNSPVYHNNLGRTIVTNSDGSKTILQKNRRQLVEIARIPPMFKEVKETRPNGLFLNKIVGHTTRIDLPHGCFNGSMLELKDKYLLIYRPNEYVFATCFLNKNFQVLHDTIKNLDLGGSVADPRIILTPCNKVFVTYSKFNNSCDFNFEYICGSIIMDLNISEEVKVYDNFRVSPVSLVDRQKNWMPFVHNDDLYLISDVCPHRIYKFDLKTRNCTLEYETKFNNPWFIKHQLRGNTNCVKIDENYFLGVFHTAQKLDGCSYYDNGAYLFEAKPPFKPVMFGNKTIFPAEFAQEKHFRKFGEIVCVFPMSIIVQGQDVYFSYGDNDSAIRVFKTNIPEVLSTMMRI